MAVAGQFAVLLSPRQERGGRWTGGREVTRSFTSCSFRVVTVCMTAFGDSRLYKYLLLLSLFPFHFLPITNQTINSHSAPARLLSIRTNSNKPTLYNGVRQERCQVRCHLSISSPLSHRTMLTLYAASSVTRSTRPPPVLPRRPTRTSPKTLTRRSEPVPLRQRTLPLTRLTSPRTLYVELLRPITIIH